MKITNLTYILIFISLLVFFWFRPFFVHIFPLDLSKADELTKIILGVALPATCVFILTFAARSLFNIFRLKGKHYNQVLTKCTDWLLSTNVQWAPTYHRLDLRVANTAEGIVALSHLNYPLGTTEKHVIKNAVDFLVHNTSSKGLQSISTGNETVQCTALGLYALMLVRKKNVHSLKAEQTEACDLLCQALINSHSKSGWSTITKKDVLDSPIRVMTTLWSIRALNSAGFGKDELIAEIMLELLRKVPNAMFGFRFNDHPKLCCISFFIVVLFELENEALKNEILNKLNLSALLRFIIKRINNEIIECEDYETKGMGLDGNIEFLTFQHMSFAYSLSALSKAEYNFNFFERSLISIRVANVLKRHLADNGCFNTITITTDVHDPYTYPTAFLITALQDYICRFFKGKDNHEPA